MADNISANNINSAIVLPVDDLGDHAAASQSQTNSHFNIIFSKPFMQKIIAEMVGTWLLIFAGCASMIVNINNDKVVTLPGIAFVWGFTVMVLIYSVGHISGAHFNPAVTIAFAASKNYPWKQVPAYIFSQVVGSTLAAGALRLVFNGKEDHFAGTLPAGSYMQSFVIEFISTFYLMFVISAVATDTRAIGELAGLAIGSTILVDVLFAGPITGASMNPARSLGPAIVSKEFKDLWIYLVAPVLGAVSGAWVYNMVRFTDKPSKEISKTASFLRSPGRHA
ncbi:aquaporin NIP1-2-like [Pistacia vera]|uniref:aquaporin NIP1-2-like n=1 Tax=Pistacia vera TaxID=55513 RepID=UPI00126370FD|nr:aquaporin NIP1-2-like [Pistacia vera]